MTQIELIYNNNLIIGFNMIGHAEYNTEGPDIICASLSAASQMTVNGLLDWTGVEFEDMIKEIDKGKGILNIEVPEPLYEDKTVQQLFKSFELYVEALSQMYVQNVKVERRYE